MSYDLRFYSPAGKYVRLVERIAYNPKNNSIAVSSYFLGNNHNKLHKIKKIQKEYSEMFRSCTKCGIILNIDENWSSQHKKKKWYICKKCKNKHSKEYCRKNIIDTIDKNGKKIKIKVIKRTRPEKCEFCGWMSDKLDYHHWDEKNPHWGLWLCGFCHKIVEIFEHKPNIIEEYIKLKRKIEEELRPNE